MVCSVVWNHFCAVRETLLRKLVSRSASCVLGAKYSPRVDSCENNGPHGGEDQKGQTSTLRA